MGETRTMMRRQRMKTRATCYPLGFVFVMVLKINAKMSTCIFYWAILSKALSLYSPNRSHLLNFCPLPLFFPKEFYPNRRSHTSIRWFWSGSIVTVMGGRQPNPAFLKSDEQNIEERVMSRIYVKLYPRLAHIEERPVAKLPLPLPNLYFLYLPVNLLRFTSQL